MHSYYERKYGYKPNDFPIAKYLSETTITLPIYPRMRDEEVQYVASSLKKIWDRHKV